MLCNRSNFKLLAVGFRVVECWRLGKPTPLCLLFYSLDILVGVDIREKMPLPNSTFPGGVETLVECLNKDWQGPPSWNSMPTFRWQCKSISSNIPTAIFPIFRQQCLEPELANTWNLTAGACSVYHFVKMLGFCKMQTTDWRVDFSFSISIAIMVGTRIVKRIERNTPQFAKSRGACSNCCTIVELSVNWCTLVVLV